MHETQAQFQNKDFRALKKLLVHQNQKMNWLQ